MGVCLICLAWAALWLRSPDARVLNIFRMGRPMDAVSLRRVLNMFGMGRHMAAVSL